MKMLLKARIRAAAIVAVLMLAGCSVARDTSCKCPKPVAYDEATLRKSHKPFAPCPPTTSSIGDGGLRERARRPPLLSVNIRRGSLAST